MNSMVKRMTVPLVLLVVSALAWFNASSLDSQSGQEFVPAVSENRSSLVTPLLSARRVPVSCKPLSLIKN